MLLYYAPQFRCPQSVTHVIHLHVVLIVSVDKIMDTLYAHVLPVTLVHLQLVDRNVLSVQIAHRMKLATIRNVVIRALEFVELELRVTLLITIQFVLVHQE